MHIPRLFPAGVLAATLAGCATPPPQAPAPAGGTASVLHASSAEACSAIVYRTQSTFHSMNMEKPFVFVGTQRMGTLDTGQSMCLALSPGTHRITINEPVMFMPGWASGTLDVTVPADKPVYVRYSKEYAGTLAGGANATVTGSGKLRAATMAEWMARK